MAPEWVTEIVEQGDHWCARVAPLNDTEAERVVEVMNSMGATATNTKYGLVSVDF